MAVAVQPQSCAMPLSRAFAQRRVGDHAQGLRRTACSQARLHVQRDASDAPAASRAAPGRKSCRSSAGRVANGRALPDRVDARQKAADPFQHLGVVEFGCAAAAARAHAEREAAVLVQRAAAAATSGADGRDLGRHAARPRRRALPGSAPRSSGRGGRTWPPRHRSPSTGILQVDLVDAVLVGAQRQQAAVAVQADDGQRVQHDVGRERFIGVAMTSLDCRRALSPRHGNCCARPAKGCAPARIASPASTCA